MVVQVSVSPASFVDELVNPGLATDSGEVVAISKYLCSNAEYGGNDNAAHLSQQLSAIARRAGTSMLSLCNGDRMWSRVFSGQPKLSSLLAILDYVAEQEEALSAMPLPRTNPRAPGTYGKYFELSAPLQAMVGDKLFGYDCIGFVSRYLERVGYIPDYPSWPPHAFLTRFRPVQSADAIAACSVVAWANNTHVGIIDEVLGVEEGRNGGSATVTFCQSSAGGPQINRRVTFAGTDEIREMTVWGAKLKGRVFRMTSTGTPTAPVTGRVLIGTAPDLEFQAPQTSGGWGCRLISYG